MADTTSSSSDESIKGLIIRLVATAGGSKGAANFGTDGVGIAGAGIERIGGNSSLISSWGVPGEPNQVRISLPFGVSLLVGLRGNSSRFILRGWPVRETGAGLTGAFREISGFEGLILVGAGIRTCRVSGGLRSIGYEALELEAVEGLRFIFCPVLIGLA